MAIDNLHQFNGTEAVGQMNGQNRDDKQQDRWKTHPGHESATQNRETAEDLCKDREPGHDVRRRHMSRIQDRGEGIGALVPFGYSMRKKSIPHDQSKGYNSIFS
jgi:hypothetical protein